jgi:hypothetical protein
MQAFRLLITEITEYGDLRCVAGWDLDRRQMIRPEPRPAAFWPSRDTGVGKPFHPGNIVCLSASRPVPPTKYPHYNEDHVVEGEVQLERTLGAAEFSAELSRIETLALDAAFGPPVEFSNSKAYIRTGTNHPSLLGLRVARPAIQFFDSVDFKGRRRPRCVLTAGGRGVDLSITAVDIRELFRSKGIDAVRNAFDNARDLHIRLGLARGFGQYPERCYMQVNGIYPV